MKKNLLKTIAFLYPVTCSSCGDNMPAGSQTRICGKCVKLLPRVSGHICVKCGLYLPDGGEHCYTCGKKPSAYAFDRMRSVFIYKDKIRSLILKFKYSDRTYLYKDFSAFMAQEINKNIFGEKIDLLIPVPLNIFRRLKRGYNQAALLAAGISQETGIAVCEDVLYRKKVTRPQFKLTKKERQENIAGSFFAGKGSSLKNKNILLIDDIATTSATASACADVLKKAGAKRVFAMTLARD